MMQQPETKMLSCIQAYKYLGFSVCLQIPHHKYDQNHILALTACMDTKITCIVMKSETRTGTEDFVWALFESLLQIKQKVMQKLPKSVYLCSIHQLD